VGLLYSVDYTVTPRSHSGPSYGKRIHLADLHICNSSRPGSTNRSEPVAYKHGTNPDEYTPNFLWW